MVRYKRSELPPLTEERKAELRALAERPDSEIDYSDLPPLVKVLNTLTVETMEKTACGGDVHKASDAEDLFRQLSI
ncbi:hypothetical protein [Brucella endophytica]|nr:hypothetical protein [Brucella endophytica]